MKSKKLVKEKRLSNPNKVNQYTGPDPRQALFLSLYLDRKSPSFGNAFQSAIDAKYEESYALVLKSSMPDWLSENLKKERFVEKAERHFEEILDMPVIVQAMGAFGPIFRKEETFVNKKLKNGKTKRVKVVNKIPVMVYSTSHIKEKTRVAEVVAEAHDKANYGKAAPGVKLSFNFTQVNGDKEKFK